VRRRIAWQLPGPDWRWAGASGSTGAEPGAGSRELLPENLAPLLLGQLGSRKDGRRQQDPTDGGCHGNRQQGSVGPGSPGSS